MFQIHENGGIETFEELAKKCTFVRDTFEKIVYNAYIKLLGLWYQVKRTEFVSSVCELRCSTCKQMKSCIN
jgi:hypothetical protein